MAIFRRGASTAAPAVGTETARVLLAGNPNSGKTSLFNALTGASQRVGNYPGITVEKREGRFDWRGRRFELIDLPGTYSLSSWSPEERIAQGELLNEEASVVVVVVDSTTLRRGLVLLAQVMQLGANPVLCLNMADEARRAGQKIDLDLLRQLLGFPVVETAGHRGEGVVELREAIGRALRSPVRESRLVLGERLDDALRRIGESMKAASLNGRNGSWLAGRLLLGDGSFEGVFRNAGPEGCEVLDIAARERERIEAETGMDVTLFTSERYFGFVNGLLREVLRTPPRANAREISDRIDSVVAHPVLGVPIFLAIMYGIFHLTFALGEAPMGWIEAGFDRLAAALSGLAPAGAESPLLSLAVDGIIGGVGGVIVFLPNIILLFFGLALLEDTGYMARAAFLVDRLMHRFGLHGKSFVPLMTGFGCSIPGIMATRTLENEKDRLTTMLVLPLMSCGARLPIWMLLIPAFFAEPLRAPMLWFIYMSGIALALALSLALRRTVLKGEDAPFVMELPPYRFPTARALVRKMTERSWLYIRKAGTVILGLSVVLWFLSTYPKPENYRIDAAVAAGAVRVVEPAGHADAEAAPRDGVPAITGEELANIRLAESLRYSLAGRIGAAMEPLIRPLGFDWKLGTAMIGAFAAKEVFVAQMGIVYSLGETGENATALRDILRRDYSPLVGVSLMLFLLISAPCMATVAVTRRESGSWKWALLQLGGLTTVAYVVSLAVYRIGGLFF